MKATALELVPVTLDEAKAFVAANHRHNEAPLSWKFGVGLSNGSLCGVAMAGRPNGRGIDKKLNLEVTRVCTLENKNANSRLYGAISRAAKALGYRRLYTYTLQTESGSSLRAAGFRVDEHLKARPTWDTPARRRYQQDIFGNQRRPPEAKIRWIKDL